MDFTNIRILVISPSGISGGKATFTNLLLDVFRRNNVFFYHINLQRTKSDKLFFKIFEHIISFFYFKVKFLYYLIFKKFDIVQIHTSTYFDFFDLSIFIIISKLFGKKTVVRYGGAQFPIFYKSLNKFLQRYVFMIIEIIDTLIVQSDYWSDYFIEFGKKKEKLFILPNFIDLVSFKVDLKKYDEGIINILFIPGNDLERKGFFDVKETIIELADKYQNIIFHIVGPKVEMLISAKNIKTYKIIHGMAKLDMFNLCCIYLLPTHSEGFPNSLLEGMASGMATITTNIPQIKCIVKDGFDAYLIDPGSRVQFKEKVEYLLKNPSSIIQVGRNARKNVEKNYSLDLLYGYLKNLY